MNKQMKESFEKWFLGRFGADKKHLLQKGDTVGYYHIRTADRWMGFEAGVTEARTNISARTKK